MKKLLLLLTSIVTLSSYSQSVEIINKSEVKNLSEGKKFDYVESITDTNFLQFVATIQAKEVNKKCKIESLFSAIQIQANKLGATCFKINSFKRDNVNNQTLLVLDCYFAWEATLNMNAANHERNVVYIFGNENEDKGRTITVNVNNKNKEIKAGEYLKFILKEGAELKINKGGFTGETGWLKWAKDKPPAFYSLNGLGLAELSQQPANGIGFNTGRINTIANINLGLLLTHLLKQGN